MRALLALAVLAAALFVPVPATAAPHQYAAASRGNDALHWDELNGGRPVLTSSLGDGGVRDPFIIRSPRGDRFYLLATDLRIHGDWRLATGYELPARPRHGTVLPVPQSELDAVRAAYP